MPNSIKISTEVVGYTDSEGAGDVSDRKLTIEYVFMLAGTAVCWILRKQMATAT